MVNVLDCKSENGGSTPPPTFATQIKVHGSNQHAVSFCALPNLLREGEGEGEGGGGRGEGEGEGEGGGGGGGGRGRGRGRFASP